MGQPHQLLKALFKTVLKEESTVNTSFSRARTAGDLVSPVARVSTRARIAIGGLIMRELNYGIRMLNYPHVT